MLHFSISSLQIGCASNCPHRFLRETGHELEQPPGPQTAPVISRSLTSRYSPEVGSPFFQLRFRRNGGQCGTAEALPNPARATEPFLLEGDMLQVCVSTPQTPTNADCGVGVGLRCQSIFNKELSGFHGRVCESGEADEGWWCRPITFRLLVSPESGEGL